MHQVEAMLIASLPFQGLSYLATGIVTILSIPCIIQSVHTTGSIRTVGTLLVLAGHT